MFSKIIQRIKKEISSNFKVWCVNLLLLGVAYGLLIAVLGSDALPFSALFTLLLIWISALVFGIIFRIFTLPQLLGQLVAGILLRNIPGDILRGLRPSWVVAVRNLALSFVLMRAGLGADVREAQKLGLLAILFSFIPGLCEAIVVGLLGQPFFGFPWALSLTNGFIVAAASAAVVVVEILELRSAGFGESQGIPTLLIVSALGDILIAISGYTLTSGIAFGTGSLVWNILFGPVNVIAGVAAGIVSGALLWITSFASSKWKMCSFLILGNVACVFAFQEIRFTGAAALCAALMPVVAVLGWNHALPTPWLNPKQHPDNDLNMSNQIDPSIQKPSFTETMKLKLWWLRTEEHPEYGVLATKAAALIWGIIIAPLLFGSIGTSLNFDVITGAIFGKAVGIIAIGAIVRVLVGRLVLLISPFKSSERWFVAISMTAKATIQAALGGGPLQFYSNRPESTAEELEWANNILTISVLAILVTAAPGTFFMRFFGPKWLSRDDPHDSLSSLEESVCVVDSLNNSSASEPREVICAARADHL